MRHRRHLFTLSLLLLAASPAWVVAEETSSPMRFEACYAPGTPQEVIEQHATRSLQLRTSLAVSDAAGFTFDDADRWSATATDGGGLSQGDPMTLTWSIVPDGTSIFGYNGEPTANSALRVCLDNIYGSSAVWLPLFVQIFDRWSELNGVTYIYEPNDDGDPWTGATIAGGVLGVRGDVRISGHSIDGNSGVLAYNFFPNFGDMVIDCPDSFYSNTSGASLGLRNVLAHEHGHGLGLSHVCPVNETKLMEPFVSDNFDGPQHDDILATNRGYGDTDEHNDTSGTATSLGAVSGLTTLTPRSIDDDSDIDFWSFSVASEGTVDVSVTPIGSTYLSGPQCSAGSSFNSLAIQDLGLRVLDTDGSSALASADVNGAGSAETLTGVALSTAGTYYIEVDGDATNAAQLFELALEPATGIFSDGFESGDTMRWSVTVP